MTCNHADCDQEATMRCRMGDGWIRLPGYVKRQTYAYYCDTDFQTVDRLFRLCDISLIPASNHGPFGPFTRPDIAGTLDGLRVRP